MASGPHTTLAVEDGVGIITLVNPPVNALHPNGRSELVVSEISMHPVSEDPFP